MKKLLFLSLIITLHANAQKGFYGTAMYSAPNAERSTIVKTDTNGQYYNNVFVFPGFENVFETTEASYPYEALGNGSFFSANEYGGNNYKGCILSYDPVANSTQVIYDFNNAPNGAARPTSTPVKVNDLLIGTTLIGGQGQMGTAFMYNLTTQQYTELHADFTAINRPSLEQLAVGSNGKIYGTTSSHLYEIDLSDSSLNVLWNYSALPLEQGSRLVESGGYIYIVRRNFGSPILFRYEISSGQTTSVALGVSGDYPTGVTTDGNGGIFVYNASGNAAGDRGSLVHIPVSGMPASYPLPAPANLSVNGVMLPSIHRDANGDILIVRDSEDPGVWYNVWAFTPSTQTFDTIYTALDFRDGSDVKTISPIGNNRYIIGAAGGILSPNSWPGGIILLDLSNNSRIHNLPFYYAAMGMYEASRMTMNSSGTLAYGCNFYGGNGENGVLFSFDGEQANKLYDFSDFGINGGPFGKFHDLGDGMLYGYATNGGTHQRGYIYRFNPADTSFTILHHATHRIQAAGSNGTRLYVISRSGGTVNGVEPHLGYWDATTATYTLVANFLTENGNSLKPELAISSDGDSVYFTTMYGGTNGFGAFNRIVLNNGSNTVLHNFQFNQTGYPHSSPLILNNKIYMVCGNSGMLASPGNESTLSTASIYLTNYDLSTDTLTITETFDSQVYGIADALQILHSNNVLYFTTSKNPFTLNVIRYDLGSQSYTVSSTNADTLGNYLSLGFSELCFIPKVSATAISGPSSITENQSGITYDIANPKGYQLTWTYSGSGLTLNPSGNQVNVSVSVGATSGSLSVTAKNECGEVIFASMQLAIEQDLFTETLSANSVELFPNPTSEAFIIKNLSEETALSILDMQGRVVQQGIANPGKNFQVNQLPSGLYLVKFSTKESGEQTLKLLIH
jgi:uncharacterized repeat protein (TIGR03803 family)